MANPNEKSGQHSMTGASGIRAEPADEGVILEAADVVQPPPKPPAARDEEDEVGRPALPPDPKHAGFVNEP